MKTSRIPAGTLVALLLPATVHAADRFWIDPAGGNFADIANWSATSGGAGGATVPGVADVANITLNNPYTVAFAVDATNTGLHVSNGNVTFDFGGFTYTLTQALAVDIGTGSGQTGRLTVRDGILGVDTAGDNMEMGIAVGSTGFLTVTTNGSLGTAALRPEFVIGRSGTGTLAVNDNGRVDGQRLTVGRDFGSTGTVTITGPNAVADFSDTTMIGDSGAGTLNLTTGGTLASAQAIVIGGAKGADGTATVSGNGSLWTTSSAFVIGSGGDGTLTISAGGLVSSTGSVTLGTGGGWARRR